MGRPQEFNRTVALEKAMVTFWTQGFEATSIENLVEATGLSRQSIYNTFGDKRTFFLEALRYYQQVQGAKMLALLQGEPSVKAGFARLFEHLIEESVSDSPCRGCLTVNATTELASRDAELSALIDGSEASKEAAFAEAIRWGQARGEIPRARNPEALARFLYNGVLGLRVRAKRTPKREALQEIVDLTLSVLE